MARKRRRRIPEEIVQAKITALSHEGKGICHVNDKTVFVDGALEGETVRFRYTGKRKQIMEAAVEEVVEASDLRVEPGCEYFDICGGCSLQHLSASEQIHRKQQVLLDNLSHIGKCQPDTVLSPLNGPFWGYRRKARLGVRYVEKKGKLLVGFREKRSNFLAQIEYCKVLHPAIGMHLTDLADLVRSLSIYTQVPQIEVAMGDEQGALIVRHLAPLNAEDQNLLSQFGALHDLQIFLQSAGPDSIVRCYPKPEEPDSIAPLSYYLPEFNIQHQFRATDFTQVNMVINRKMIDLALHLLQPEKSDRVLDLFCGLGNFTLPLARRAAQVVGVEGSDDLVAQAKHNAIFNAIENVEFHSADLFKEVGQYPWAQRKYDRILLDPARSGAKEIIEYLPQLNAHTVVYVSCNPSTLARDAEIMVHQHGYQLLQAGVMDMFPHTAHVESIALFQKKRKR